MQVGASLNGKNIRDTLAQMVYEVIAIPRDRNKKERVERYIKNDNLSVFSKTIYWTPVIKPSSAMGVFYSHWSRATRYLIGSDGKLEEMFSNIDDYDEWDSNDLQPNVL